MQSEIAGDPYQVLGLSRTANADELKRAYRKLSMAWHPDRHANASEVQRKEAERRFKIVNAAYVAIGEILRTKGTAQAAAAGSAAVADRSDARVEAIRSVVASAALRLIPNLPRHTYRRVVSLVEGMLLDTLALGDRAFAGGFEAAMREAIEMAGLGYDSRADALRVLDAAADELQWRGKGADPQTWQSLLRPLEAAMHPATPGKQTAPVPGHGGLLRPEPALRAAQVLLALLCLVLLVPILPLGLEVRLLALLGGAVLVAVLTLGPRPG